MSNKEKIQNNHPLNHPVDDPLSILNVFERLEVGPVKLETHEVLPTGSRSDRPSYAVAGGDQTQKKEIRWQRVVYTMKDREISREKLD